MLLQRNNYNAFIKNEHYSYLFSLSMASNIGKSL